MMLGVEAEEERGVKRGRGVLVGWEYLHTVMHIQEIHVIIAPLNPAYNHLKQ